MRWIQAHAQRGFVQGGANLDRRGSATRQLRERVVAGVLGETHHVVGTVEPETKARTLEVRPGAAEEALSIVHRVEVDMGVDEGRWERDGSGRHRFPHARPGARRTCRLTLCTPCS